MLAWSSRRRLIYIGATAIVLGIVLFAYLYPRLNAEPSCFDGKKNGEEAGVDCGGTCQAACQFEANDIIVRWTKAFPVSGLPGQGGLYNIVAYAENQNASLGVRSISYEFKVYDADNVFIARRMGSTFIGPNSKSPIFEAGINAGNRVPARVSFAFLEEPRWVRQDPRTEDLSIYVTDQKLSDVSLSPRLSARFVNASLYPINDTDITVVLYDKEGNATLASKTLVERLAPGGATDIFFMWPAPATRQIERIEIVPRINVFNIDF